MSSWTEVSSPSTPLSRIKKIAGSSYYQAQGAAMDRIMRMNPERKDVCDALRTVIIASGYMHKRVRQRAAELLLQSSVATNEQLARVVQYAANDQKRLAAERMLASGIELDRYERSMISTYCSDLLGEKDNASKQFDRAVQAAIAP